MDTQEDKFLQQLRATFKVEAEEHVQAIAAGLLALERPPSAKAQSQIVETVFRAAHSLKGAARAVDFTEIELLCQSLEDVFVSWKRLDSVPSADALDALHRVLNAATLTLAAPAGPRCAASFVLVAPGLAPVRKRFFFGPPEVCCCRPIDPCPRPGSGSVACDRSSGTCFVCRNGENATARNRTRRCFETGSPAAGGRGIAHGKTDRRPTGGRFARTVWPL
ncbi:Hpt domain-containing protein [Polaromonas sp. P1(28)-13]|nr:Hpt domain-containing protein [Polaromonas sp. P1(28)-13]